MIKEAILKVYRNENLTYEEAEQVMNEIMEGEASPVQMSAYLTALGMKGETVEEITASASGMRAHCVRLLHNMDVLEIVGTGGDSEFLQYFDNLRACDLSRRNSGCKTWKPCSFEQVRGSGCARGTWR